MLQRTMLFFVRIVVFAFGFVFAASFLVAGVILALITSVAALISGQRPVWRVRQGSGARWQGFAAARGAAGRRASPAGEVIEAEVREVRQPAHAGERV